MGGELVDATLVAAPSSGSEKAEIKAGRIPESRKRKSAKRRQKDRAARWTVKFTKAKLRTDKKKQVTIAIPGFGSQNQILIDREHDLICKWAVTDASRLEGAMPREAACSTRSTRHLRPF